MKLHIYKPQSEKIDYVRGKVKRPTSEYSASSDLLNLSAKQSCGAGSVQIGEDCPHNIGDAVLPVLLKDNTSGLGEPTKISHQSFAFVVSKEGEQLVPMPSFRARKMIRSARAKVIRKRPFTIQLLKEVLHKKQIHEVQMKIDLGSKATGFALMNQTTGYVHTMGEIHHRQDIKKRNDERKQYRKFRRYRKTRYRKPRFNNRRKREGWMPPTLKSKADNILKIVKVYSEVCTIKNLIVEIADFDIHALSKDVNHLPNWKYQKGMLYGWENVKMFVRHRDSYTCQYCGIKNPPILDIDHIIPKLRGGTSRVDNLVACCRECNEKKEDKTAGEFGFAEIQKKVKQTLKDASHTNSIKTYLIKELEKIGAVEKTYGYITKVNRGRIGFPKTHYFDAVCIGNKIPFIKTIPKNFEYLKSVNKCLRVLTRRKGKQKRICINKLPYEVFGFRMHDKVLFEGKEGFISGRRSNGRFKISDIEGNLIKDGISYKKLKLVERRRQFLYVLKRGISLP